MIRKLAILGMMAVLLMAVGCSKDRKAMLPGMWKASQAAQEEGSHEEIAQYSALSFDSSSNVTMLIFHEESGADQTAVRVIDREKNAVYRWEASDQIVIDNRTYHIELDKQKLTLSNDQIEIQFNKESQK